MRPSAIDISKPAIQGRSLSLFYAQLRTEHAVFPVRLLYGQTALLITRYDDALSAIKDRRFSKDKLNAGQKQSWMPTYFKPLARNMLDLDDPDHARLRGLVEKAFTPKIVESMRQGIAPLTEKIALAGFLSNSSVSSIPAFSSIVTKRLPIFCDSLANAGS